MQASASKKHLKGFNSDEWKEIRFDIDKKVNPDIVGTLTDMSLVESSSVDAIYSSHNIEHIYPHEIPRACNLLPQDVAVASSSQPALMEMPQTQISQVNSICL